ncbi:MAG: oxygenase MpaB family protein [Actinomycetota bacterium]
MVSVQDLGYFGPDSVSWQVHREVTVLFGGARALLLQSAHPLVVAGARQTGMFQRNPWKRLQRTLLLQYTLTFGTRAQADAAAERINAVHGPVHGIDEVTGKRYDALDPELLLWVHAVLVDSALLFERLTIGRLDDVGRQRFHDEQKLAAEFCRVPRDMIPATIADLRAYLRDMLVGDQLLVTDDARTVAGLFAHPPAEAEWKPVLRAVSWWAFGTLPSRLREGYGVRWNRAKQATLRSSLAGVKLGHRAIPPKYRYIAPYQEWVHRRRGQPSSGVVEQARKQVGIRLPSGPDPSR